MWDEASQSLSQSLSLSLASIVVLLFTVVLRSLAYLSARDRTEAQLRRARAEAEAATLAKSEFLATMSHEIRTPLTAIKGYAELLDATPLDPSQRDHLGRLRDAGDVLGTLIDDILDLSKIEAGRIDLHRGAVDISALAERVIALVRPVAAAKGLSLACSVAEGLPRHIEGDAGRLLQVLLNLTNNAVKFTAKGGVTLAFERRGESLAVIVRDSGIGIAAADMGLLFKRFSQIDSSLTRAHGGSGLGLAISQGLVQQMGGEITVESVVGQGSSFTVTLPLRAAAEPQPQQVPHPAGLAQAPQGARVLIVEDSAQNQDLIRAVLTRAGYACRSALDGVEGLEAARAGAVDLVIMDMQMPRMDGISATAAIRALEGPAGRVPILALSANARPDQAAAMARAGADRHLAKPFGIEDLTQTVGALLAGRLPEAARPAPPPQPALRDEAALASLVELLGAEWVRGRLGAVLGDLDWITTESDGPDLRKRAHRLISEAGQLGFPALAEAAHQLEEAIDAGAPLAALRATLAERAASAKAFLPALLDGLGRG
nr:ATP-binding protein [Gemmobacter straminiformis]